MLNILNEYYCKTPDYLSCTHFGALNNLEKLFEKYVLLK